MQIVNAKQAGSTLDALVHAVACVTLGLKHRLHSSYEKSIVVERAIEYLKDRRDI